MTIAALGEDGILAILNRHFSTTWPEGFIGPGDDAAVIVSNGRYVICTDVMNEGQHFLRTWPSGIQDNGYSTGWKLAAQNLSDVSSMGARPTTLTLALSMPPTTEISWVNNFAAGIMGAITHLGATDCKVAGGDLSSAPFISAALTATGELDDNQPRLRQMATGKRTDGLQLIHTGYLGASAAGLAVAQAESFPAKHWRDAIRVLRLFLRPRPPLGAGNAFLPLAMMDVSDGLTRDAQRLATANNMFFHLDDDAVAARAKLLQSLAQAVGADAEEWVRTGGEDYGLLAVIGADEQPPAGWMRVGKLFQDSNQAKNNAKNPQATTQDGLGGWDHFQHLPRK